MPDDTRIRRLFRRLAVFSGMSLLALAGGLLAALAAGLPVHELLPRLGQSTLRTIGGLAVAGCLITAIGYWE